MVPRLHGIDRDRNRLGDLWLPWYVHHSDHTQPFSWEHDDPVQAQQLRVRELAIARVWQAMSQPDPQKPAESHARCITEYEDRYRDAEAVVLVLPAWSTPEGQVIIDGAHRACALYRLAPAALDADVIAVMSPPDCLDTQTRPRNWPRISG